MTRASRLKPPLKLGAARRLDAEHAPSAARPLVAKRTSYADGYHVEAHWHAHAQFLYAVEGTMAARVPRHAWIVPSSRALWIPPRTVHDIRMKGGVEMRSLFVDESAAAGMPEHAVVLDITPLLRELMVRVTARPAELHATAVDAHAAERLLMPLILSEIRQLRPAALSLPLPQDAALLDMCEALMADLTTLRPAAATADGLNVSSRTLYRRFLRETGLSFAAWAQQARLLEAVRRLGEGAAVTAVALELGYESPSAFSTMFRRVLGQSPREFARRGAVGATPVAAVPTRVAPRD